MRVSAGRFLPLFGVAVFMGIVFVWRPWLQRRRHGTSGIVLFRSRDQLPRDVMAVVLFALLLGQAVVAAWSPQSLSPLALDEPARGSCGLVEPDCWPRDSSCS